jgi:hypothetical protein
MVAGRDKSIFRAVCSDFFSMPNLPLLMHARLGIPGDFRLRVGLFLPLHLILWAIELCRDVCFVGVWCAIGDPVYRIRRGIYG